MITYDDIVNWREGSGEAGEEDGIGAGRPDDLVEQARGDGPQFAQHRVAGHQQRRDVAAGEHLREAAVERHDQVVAGAELAVGAGVDGVSDVEAVLGSPAYLDCFR